MCRICDLELRENFNFKGVYRIRKPKQLISRLNRPYMTCTLEDATGALRGYMWTVDSLCELNDMDLVSVTCNHRTFNQTLIVDILEIEKFTGTLQNPLDLIPSSCYCKPDSADLLGDIVNLIRHNALKRFVQSVLADDTILLPFISIPASTNHHHNQPGELLEHSLDCALKVSHLMSTDDSMSDLAVVGALFHDIGKVRTITAEGKLTSTGRIISHDDLTLETLDPHLRKLDKICTGAGNALRYIWTWKNRKSRGSIPITVLAEVVSAVDRISTGLYVEEELFRDKPVWQRFAKYTDNTLHWRAEMDVVDLAA